MADFIKWAAAAETGWNMDIQPGYVMAAYSKMREKTISANLEDNPIATAINSLLEDNNPWEGTAAELLEALEEKANEKVLHSKAWPNNSLKLVGQIRRMATFLRHSGVGVEFSRTKNKRIITLSLQVSDNTVTTVTTVTNSAYLYDNQLLTTGDSSSKKGDSINESKAYCHLTVTQPSPPQTHRNQNVIQLGDSGDSGDSIKPLLSGKVVKGSL